MYLKGRIKKHQLVRHLNFINKALNNQQFHAFLCVCFLNTEKNITTKMKEFLVSFLFSSWNELNEGKINNRIRSAINRTKHTVPQLAYTTRSSLMIARVTGAITCVRAEYFFFYWPSIDSMHTNNCFDVPGRRLRVMLQGRVSDSMPRAQPNNAVCA